MSVLSGHTINRPVWIFILGCGLLLSASGCSTILTVAYLFHPEDVPAEYSGLRGKHVVVVCKPIVELEFTDAGTARELAERIGANIRENVRGVKIISQQEVSRWLDENAWVDYPTLGKSVDADLVVGIDLDHFSLHEGSTLFTCKSMILKMTSLYLIIEWKISHSQQTVLYQRPTSLSNNSEDFFYEFWQAVFRDAFMPMKAELILLKRI